MIVKFQASIYIRLFMAIVLIGMILSSCQGDDGKPKPLSKSINKIMPLGASRVEGARPEFESYRYELWKLLVDGGWEFDYIGTMTDDASYSNFSNLSFDTDHEGRGGWTSDEILANVNEWLGEVGSPDIVLFSSPGGNDILNGLIPFDRTVSNINGIIDILQAQNPNVTIIIEELAPGQSSFMTAELSANFSVIQQEVKIIANEQTSVTSQVITVDMYTGFNDSYLADNVHYNEAGAKFIADRYYDILQNVLKSE